jgi:hypothetical protein
MNSYRFDKRSKTQFKKDIRKGHQIQSQIIDRWLISIKEPDLQVWDNGVNNDGKYIAARKVTSDPDYEVEKYGLVEVQYASPMLKDFFHIKQNKILTCIRQHANILMVNGWGSEEPTYTLLTEQQCKVIKARFELVEWFSAGNKKAYRVPLRFFEWETLQE